MSQGIHISGPVGFLESSGATVFFSKSAANAGTYRKNSGTAVLVKQIQTAINVAYWGEDNRFPQNIEQQMKYYGLGKAALEWKAKALFGAGILPGKITGYEDNAEKFEPLDRNKYKEVFQFLENRAMFRFFMEYLLDWVWYGNCFPEAIFNNNCDKITHFVHQESCDARFKQTTDGIIKTVYLSKLWGMSRDQFAQFDPEKKVPGCYAGGTNAITEVDGVYIKALDAVDMYDPINSINQIAEKQKKKGAKELKSCIFPTNYPSPNKTYYQVPAWDGARLGGWIEIACKIPAMIKLFLKKGQKIQYHIEVPETYFEKKYTKEVWATMMKDEKKQQEARLELLKQMDEYLTSDKAAFSTFVSFFDIDHHSGDEKGRIKITPIEGKYSVDKDVLTTSAADLQTLASMGVHPTLFGAGAIGGTQQRTGGSDQREAFLIYNAMLNLERQVALEPLYLARDFNKWGDDIVFRVLDTKLTTLDQNKGTEKVVS